MSPETVAALESCRAAEKEQALFYRSLAAAAEAGGDEALASRFHDLHADEQHHLSRLTARLVELGVRPASVDAVTSPGAGLGAWAAEARRRELREVDRYGELLTANLDDATRALVREIHAVEEHHAEELAGKWTLA
ncbi:MAG TPA: hypothetical protein VFL93_00335 [Longimicrobiaceae bacterium]|nr:hypothetical protein [Longimicrobiaceae bacterium]